MERDERKLEGKECEFNSHGADSELSKFDGTVCKVLRRIPEDEYDFEEVGTIWDVELEDGTKLGAFADEVIY